MKNQGKKFLKSELTLVFDEVGFDIKMTNKDIFVGDLLAKIIKFQVKKYKIKGANTPKKTKLNR